MKYLFTLTLSCCLFLGLSAQDIFQKHVGSIGADYMTDMQRLSDGSFIALGYSVVKSVDSSYAQLFKLDAAMNVVWSKSYSFNKQMRTTDITPTADGGYLIAGRTWSTPATTKQGGFVIKADATGTATWSRIIKFDGSETMLKVMEEADKTLRYFVSGATTTHYIKAAADGTTTSTPIAPTNGAYDIVGKKVVRISAERYALIGKFQNTADCIMMLNKDTIQWTQQYFGIINEGRIFNLTTDAKGDLYFAGDYKVSAYDLRQTHVGKIATANGAIQWRTVLPLVRNGGRGIDTTWRFTIGNHLQVSGRQLYVSGSMLNEQKSFSYACISAFDTASASRVGGDNWKWTRQYGSRTGTSDSFARVFVLPNGQLLGAGNTGLGGNAANPNFYFVKTDTAGVSSCNYDSYSPVETVSSSAYLNIYEALVGLAPAQQTMTTYTDAIPTTDQVTLGTTASICAATLCVGDPVTATVSPTAICVNDSVTISATGAAAYLWSSLALPTTRTDSTFKVRINSVGTTTFLLSGTPRGQSCFAAKSISVLVRSLPFPPISGTGIPTRYLCRGDSLTVLGGVTVTKGSKFTWSSETNSPWRQGSDSVRIIVKPIDFGLHKYNLSIKDTFGCVNTGVTSIVVREFSTPTVTIDPIGCPGPDLTLRARGTSEGVAPFFDWLLDGTTLVGGRRELFLPNAIGKKIQVYMTLAVPAITNATDICIAPPGSRQIKSPIITISCQGVSTKDLVDGLQNITVYPNPTEGAFSVKINLETSKTVSFRVLNILGQTIQQIAPKSVSSGEIIQEFDVNNVPAGIYLVETKLDNKSVITKLQIQ
jgi:Secretion system C-terminal sorting domain